MNTEQSATQNAAAAWKVLQAMGYVNKTPFQETQGVLRKAQEILEILNQTGIDPAYWEGVIGMAATFDVHMRAGELPLARSENGERDTAADNLEFLRDFLEGKTRWNLPEGTVFNVNISTGDGAEVQLKPEADGEPEPPAGQDGGKADVLLALKELCRYSRSREGSGDYRWKRYTAAMEFAISVLSELREIKEVRIQAEPNTPGVWELMRDILEGKRPAPEGTVFDVVIDLTGNPQAIRRREEPKAAARALTLTMPGGEQALKQNSKPVIILPVPARSEAAKG